MLIERDDENMNANQTDINVLTQSLDIEQFKAKTVKTVLSETEANLRYEKDNPDSTGAFPGIDGKWYVINFPCERYNAYMFALGWTIEVGSKVGYGYPGIMSGKLPSSKMECVQLIMNDINAVGRQVHEIIMQRFPRKLPKAEKGTYWIKIFFAQGTIDTDWSTVHLARKDEASGRWLHKLGWVSPPKVMTDNLEVSTIYDWILKNNPRIRESEKRLPPGTTKNFLKGFGYNLDEKIVSKSKLETRDNAPYKAYNPEEDEIHFKVYEPYAILRIDE